MQKSMCNFLHIKLVFKKNCSENECTSCILQARCALSWVAAGDGVKVDMKYKVTKP